MILLEKVLDERKRQKQEKENDNANNTRSNSTGIIRENDKTEPREISQSSSLSDPKRNGGYSTMATLGLSDNLQTIRFKRELSESLSRNTDEPRNTAQSRLSGAESRESRAEIEGSEVIRTANNKLYKFNDEKIPSKLSKEENKEFNIPAL
ncbi:hypothetical protein [Campylobacter jejuni]|uniref:hypothetical protein n=2 Tax=Campylobacter jejuni TaxID=197 RepID=UPI001564D051|nr:hypothetical protein [Campylobacter jejuni]